MSIFNGFLFFWLTDACFELLRSTVKTPEFR